MIEVSKEMAEQEFNRLCDIWDIDIDEGDMDQEDINHFKNYKSPIVRAIKQGRASVDESGTITFQLRSSIGDIESLSFPIPKGSILNASDRYKANQNVARVWGMLAAITKVNDKLLASMDYRDSKFCMAFINIFLA